jgi:DNA-binding IclR family transcriptional regulator
MDNAREGVLSKGIRVLSALRRYEEGASARELASAVGLPRSTVQRLLSVLQDTDMATQDPETQRYRVGPQALLIGLGYNRSNELLRIARPHMIALRDRVGETVGLSVAVGAARVFLEEVQSTEELRTVSELGTLYPLWSGASGRVLMSGLSDADITEVLASTEHAKAVQNPLEADETRHKVRRAAGRGFETAFDEAIRSVSSLAVPIFDADSSVLAALSISGPAERLTVERLEAVREDVQEAGRAIGVELAGWRR